MSTKKKTPTVNEQEAQSETPSVDATQIINYHEAERTMILANMMRRSQEDKRDEERLTAIANIIATAQRFSPPPPMQDSDENQPA